MDSAASSVAASDAEEQQLLPARRLPAVMKTYGKSRAEQPASALQADQSFTSDLTSLSQLSQAPAATSEGDVASAPVRTASSTSTSADPSSEDGSEGASGNGGREDDSGYAVHESIRYMLNKVDLEYDARPDSDFTSTAADATFLPADLVNAAPSIHQRVASGDSSSSVNIEGGHKTSHKIALASTSSPHSLAPEQTSPPTSPVSHSNAPAVNQLEGEASRSPEAVSRKTLKVSRRVLDSDDDDTEEGNAGGKTISDSPKRYTAPRHRSRHHNRVIDSEDESEAGSETDGKAPSSEDDGLTSLKKVAQAIRQAPKSSGSDIEIDEIETQKTEDIETWNDSQVYQSNRRSESPDVKIKKEKKPKPISKKALEETYKVAEQARRSRQASIMPRSRPARPLSEITQKLQGPDSSRPLSSMRPTLPHRPRSATVKPALSLRASSVPASSLQPAPTASNKIIEIGSSSAIFEIDEDSYNTKFLQADSQSQSQDSYSNNSGSRLPAEEDKPTAPTKLQKPLSDDDDDEELPDVQLIFEQERKARALREKKAKLLAMQQLKESANVVVKADVKGKGREMSLSDSEAEELEVVVPRAATPVIKAAHHTPRSHTAYRKLAPKSIKQEYDVDIDESQIRRAGRTFAGGQDKVFVAPHVAMKTTRSKPTKKAPNAVNSMNINRHLLEKAQTQAFQDKLKRQEDWKRRGGTLRYDATMQDALMVGNGDGDEDQEEQTKELMEAIRADAEKQSEGDEEDDDSDYRGSDEEEAILSGSDVGSVDEEDDEEAANSTGEGQVDGAMSSRFDKRKTVSSEDMDAELSSITATEVIPSNPEDEESDVSEEEMIVTVRRNKHLPKASSDDEADEVADAKQDMRERSVTSDQAREAVKSTQYHEFVVKGGTEAFPEAGTMRAISLTQAFGEAGATQAMPQASRAMLDDADDFGDMFGEDGTEGFTQTQAPTQKLASLQADAPLPSMFRKSTDASPQLQRHAFGEAPMLLDAALRDAQIREEAERAHDQIQLARARSVTTKLDNDVTRTPGSTLSEELPPLPPVSIVADRYSDRGMSEENSIPFDLSDDENKSTDSPIAPRRLRRAGSGSPTDVIGPIKAKTAFDLLREGQQRKTDVSHAGNKNKKKQKHSEFIAEEVEESEDEGGMYSMLRKDDGEGDESGSDLDATVEELVDDEEGDAEEVEKQDELADEKHREYEKEKDARTGKFIEKVIKGQMKRKGRGHGGDLSDSDYEDETMHREAKARKQRKYTDKMAALADNPETQSFARVAMEDGVTEFKCDFLEGADPTSEAASSDNDEDWDMDDENEAPAPRRGAYRPAERAYIRAGSEIELSIINSAIYGGVPSSPRFEANEIQDNLLAIATRTAVTHRPGADVFEDIEFSYEIRADHGKRRTVQFEKDDSQNDRGLGPGKNSAVTSFVKKGVAQGAGRSGHGHSSSRSTGNKPSAHQAKKLSSLNAGKNAGGRLAAFRQGKR